MKPVRKRGQVWHPADYDVADIRAVQAVTAGAATLQPPQLLGDHLLVFAAVRRSDLLAPVRRPGRRCRR
jgi:hypothetical protein